MPPPCRAHSIGIALALWMAATAHAAGQAVVAVPYYTPAAYMQGVIQHHHAPLADHFQRDADALVTDVQSWCGALAPQSTASLTLARAQWTRTLVSWSALSAVAIGPLVDRRSARRIDFQPIRLAMIDKGVALAAPTLSGLDTIGAPGRGLPALEWLLWAGPAEPDTPSCRYAALLAQDVAQEASALNAGFQNMARQDLPEDAAWSGPAMGEVFNQWTGAIETLRWKELGKPLASAPKGQRPAFARPFSQQSTQAWAAQWSSIQALSVLSGERAPAPGAALIPIEAYLRGRGLNTLAQSLVDATSRTDRAMRALTRQPSNQTCHAAMNALDALKHRVENQIAPALQISIGFSDADGD